MHWPYHCGLAKLYSNINHCAGHYHAPRTHIGCIGNIRARMDKGAGNSLQLEVFVIGSTEPEYWNSQYLKRKHIPTARASGRLPGGFTIAGRVPTIPGPES